MMHSSIDVVSVSYEYVDVPAIRDLSIAVEPGELVCLVGPNGSGKSTALRLLAGEIAPSRGTVTVHGTSITDLGPRERAVHRAFLAQDDRTDIPYAVRTVVGFGTYVAAIDEEDKQRRIDAALASVEITHLAHRPVSELSGGERRRTAIARTLAHDAPVLLMDEPTDSLDLGHAEMVMRLCRTEAASGRTVVVSTHDLNLAARHADRVVMLAAGTTRASGTPDTVLEADLLSEIYDCTVRVARHPVDGKPLIYL